MRQAEYRDVDTPDVAVAVLLNELDAAKHLLRQSPAQPVPNVAVVQGLVVRPGDVLIIFNAAQQTLAAPRSTDPKEAHTGQHAGTQEEHTTTDGR